VLGGRHAAKVPVAASHETLRLACGALSAAVLSVLVVSKQSAAQFVESFGRILEKWGGIVVSANGVWRCLRRHGLNTRARRLSLVAGYRAPYEPPREPGPELHIEVERPGELVGFDCFFVGRLKGTDGAVWQLTAIDCYSSYAWAELVVCREGNPSAKQTSTLARRVARELKRAGWRLERVLCDNGNEFKGPRFHATVDSLGAPRHPHPRRSPADERPRRGAAQDDPRRVLASRLRPLPVPALQRTQARARALSRLLQPRSRPPRPPHPRPHPRRPRLRCPQDGGEMNRNCRHISETVQSRTRGAVIFGA
jgi:Integrase core domain